MQHSLARHSLVWLTPAGWDRALAGMAQPDRAMAIPWRDHDWPGVVRRSESPVKAGTVPLGLPLPPALPLPRGQASGPPKGPRLGCVTALEDIRTVRGAVPLEATLDDALPSWRPSLRALIDALLAEGIVLRVYGSLAFQHLTGRQYLRPASDIDVLLHPSSAAQLLAGVDVLERFAGRLPLDGEIAFPDGRAVAWKEWRQAQRNDAGAKSCPPSDRAARVLAKHAHGIDLIAPQQLLDGFQNLQEVMPC